MSKFISFEKDLNRFYQLQDRLRDQGFERCLEDAHGHMMWPAQGVYFFFDDSEKRQDNKTPRVVRVGTHALNDNANTTLWKRLRQHKGTVKGHYAGGGNHRISAFRKHVGYAMIARGGHDVPSWGTSPRMREHEHQLETERV